MDRRSQAGLAALLYLGYAFFLTWPLVLHMGSDVFGAAGNDEFSLLAIIREYSQNGHTPFTPETLHAFAAPEGLRVDWALNLTNWPSWLVLWPLAVLFRATFAIDAFILLGYTLNGVSMFLLTRRITRSPGAALIAGFAFAFFPFAVVKGTIHQQFMHVWVFVLLAWRLLALSERPTLRNGVMAGLAAIVAVSWTSYFALFAGVLFGAFAAFDLVEGLIMRRDRLRPLLMGYGVAAVMVVAVLVAYLIIASASSSSALGVQQPISELYTYSARPLEYLLPDAHNLIFGTLTSRYLFTHAHGSGYGEFNLYLGLVPLAFCIVAVVALLRRRLADELRRPLLLFMLVALAAAWVSAPPTWQAGSMTIPFPSDLIHHYVSGVRVYSRLVTVVMVGVAVCTGIGLAHVLQGRARAVRVAAVSLLLPVVALDLWARPNPTVSTLPHPAVYKILKHEPAGIVAEYPITPAVIPNYEPLLDQPQHGHPILNGYGIGTDQEARALELAQLNDPLTASRLALLGVRYIVVNEGPLPEFTPAPGTPGRGFRLIANIGDRALYRVVARSASSWVIDGGGFSPPEGPPSSPSQWLTTSTSDLQIRATCGRCTGVLMFGTSSFAQPRTMEIRDQTGRLLLFRRIPTSAITVSVRLKFSHVDRLALSVDPAPQSALAASGGTDDRDLGIIISNPRFLGARNRGTGSGGLS